MKIQYYVSFLLINAIAAVAAFTSIASAETSQEANVRKLIKSRLGEVIKIDSVSKTPYSGLYEIRSGNGIAYTDEKAKFLFRGEVIDTQNFTNYTRERIEELSKIKFSDLPLNAAVKMVRGDGKRVIAVFEDPNCGYCKLLRQTFQTMDNVTVYTFMLNILSEDSATRSRNIWCSAERDKAWDDWMLNGKEAAKAADTCVDPNNSNFELAHKLNVVSTPTIFFADGTRISGAIDANQFEQKFTTVK